MSEHADSWPPHERFPYNYTDFKVKVVIEDDLNQSKNPLIITGYASLEKIIDFLSDNHQRLQRNSEAFNIIRILLGNEPYPTGKQEFSSSNKFSEEIVEFWRERGISILKCAKVLAAIELLKNSKVQARIANKKPIHAKIYKGDNSYENIANLCKDISDSRQQTKTSQLIELLDNHKLVIVFDNRLISLHDLKRHLDQHKHGEVIIATGANQKKREEINQMFQLGSEKSGIIALCSDAMSEGVNLQQASAVVQLTMPSVMRLAEQRIGRIDRMDSPHSTIEALWPKDSNEFALRSSESKFFARHNLVSDLFGSNLPLPEDFSPEKDTDSSDDVVTSEDDLVKLEDKTWELGDVFDPVRSLVEGEGSLIENKRSLVSREIYNQNRTSKARGNSCLSFVDAHPEEPSWAFFAIAGTEWGAPRWVYLDELDPPITDLEEISKKLRKNLFIVSEYPNRETATICLEKFLKKLIKTEKMLLPKKKQRTLDEMKLVLTKYKDKAVKEKDDGRDRLCNFMLSLHEEVELGQQRIDLSLLAEWWIDLIRPQWFSRLKEHRRFEPLRLQDIREDLIQNPIPTEKLNEVFKVPKVKPLDKRIVAAIIGI